VRRAAPNQVYWHPVDCSSAADRATGAIEEANMAEAPSASLGDKLAAPRANWRWFVGLGAVLIVAGLLALANLVAGTLAAVLFVATMMLVGGIAQIVHAFQVKEWRPFLFWLLAGVLYAVAAALIFFDPLFGATALTLLVAASLLATGVLRLIVAFQVRPEGGWQWLAAAGAATVLLGILIAVQWPTDAVWVLGLLLGVELVFAGVALVNFGLWLRPAR
jgi:uncharacterized membrane protein HdeD (DUF308 family)